MQDFMNFWEHIATWQRMVILLGGMIFFWLIEGYYPLFTFSWKRYKHAGTNLVFLGTTVLLNLIFGAVTLWICDWVTKSDFGLLFGVEKNDFQTFGPLFYGLVWPVYPTLYHA